MSECKGVSCLFTSHISWKRGTDKDGARLQSEAFLSRLAEICHCGKQSTRETVSDKNSFHSVTGFNQLSASFFYMLRSMMWHQSSKWLIGIFNMSDTNKQKRNTFCPFFHSTPKKCGCMSCDVIWRTLAGDNKTNWFHKSPWEHIVCYELRQRDFSKIQREEFCTASFLSSHLFNLSPSFLSKAAPKQQANKADLLSQSGLASRKWGCLFSASE